MTSTWGDQDRRTESSRLACATIGNPILTGKETDKRKKRQTEKTKLLKYNLKRKLTACKLYPKSLIKMASADKHLHIFWYA